VPAGAIALARKPPGRGVAFVDDLTAGDDAGTWIVDIFIGDDRTGAGGEGEGEEVRDSGIGSIVRVCVFCVKPVVCCVGQ
jgi:hypothetical protein